MFAAGLGLADLDASEAELSLRGLEAELGEQTYVSTSGPTSWTVLFFFLCFLLPYKI